MTERFEATRTISVPPAAVFALLADPARHRETEPGDWVREAVAAEPITGTGQTFAMNMYLEQVGGDYVMHNLVTEFEQDRTIAWAPGQLGESGDVSPMGWWWRYDLAPNGQATDVTLTYDWSGTPQRVRELLPGLPPFGEGFIAESLEALDRALT